MIRQTSPKTGTAAAQALIKNGTPPQRSAFDRRQALFFVIGRAWEAAYQAALCKAHTKA
jgi:hypothetical protein